MPHSLGQGHGSVGTWSKLPQSLYNKHWSCCQILSGGLICSVIPFLLFLWDEISKRRAINRKSIFGHFFIIRRKIQNNFWTEKHRSFICSIHSSRWRMQRGFLENAMNARHTTLTERKVATHTCKNFGSVFRAQIYQSKTLTLIIVQVLLVGSKCSYQCGFL